MEEITMERLLTNFNEVVNEFKQLVDNKDIAGVKKALAEVEGLLANEQGIELDRAENLPFDHILHHFLSSIGGYIEKEEIIPGTPDATLIEIEEYRARILILLEERIEIENELKAIEDEENGNNEPNRENPDNEVPNKNESTKKIVTEETIEVLFEDYEDTSNPEQERQRIAEELNIDPNELEITWSGADGVQSDDGPVMPYKIIRRHIKETEVEVDLTEIDNRIAELEAEIARRLEAWENTLQYTENADERKEQFDRGTEKLRAELEKLRLERQNFSVEVEEPAVDLTEIDNRIAELEAEIARRLEAWENTLQYTENADERKEQFDRGTEKLRAELEKLRLERQNFSASRDNSDEIKRLKKAIEDAYEELRLAENGKFSPANSQWRLDLIDHIDLLKRKLAELENAKVAQEPSNKEPSERKKALLERLTVIDLEINDLTVKITEIEGKEGFVNRETFDVDAEVKRIGDKVFKTADIRRELTDRNVSREEFLAFYREGLAVSEANIQRLKEEMQKLNDELSNIFTDKESDSTLFEQLREAGENGDKTAEIAVYEKMRKNFLAQGYNGDIFQKEIITEEDANKFAEFLTEYIKETKEQGAKINNEINDQELGIKIFKREINIIEKEIESLKMLQDERDGIEAKASREKDLRARQIRATMFGNEDLAKEYDERFKRFYSHKVTLKETYIDENGKEKEVQYESIENYPEYEDDAFFLNLEDYKRSLETTTKYRNSGNDLYALGEDFVDLLESQPNKQLAVTAYQEKLKQAEEYVRTFHGHTNKYKVKYETYMNAGSTLKGMVPVKDLPPLKKVGAVTENVFRFLGLRKPEFTKYDQNGNKVRDLKGGLITLGLDALTVGTVTAVGVIGGPAGLAGIGMYYAARGVVTAGNLAAGGITKARNKEDIESNRPTPYSVSKDDREVARKDYYRNIEKLGKVSSWLKAKNDRWLFRDRARETEEKITDLEIRNANARIDRRTDMAKRTIDVNIKKANENQQKRQENQRKVAQSKETYNETIKDPDSVSIEQATSIIAQNAAIRSHGGTGKDINPNSQAENTHQYVKADPNLGQTEKLDDVVTKGGTTAATAITEEEKYTARQQKQNRVNTVATMVLATVGNIGLNFIRGKFVDQVTKYKQGPDTIKKEPIYTEQETIEMPEKISDLKLKPEACDNIYDGDTTRFAGDVLTTGNPETMSDPAGIAIRYVTKDGKEIGVSIAEEGYGLTTTHPHVNLLTRGSFRNKTMTEVFDLFKQLNPTDGSGSFMDIISQPEFQGKAPEEIMKMLLKEDAIWLQNSKMGGWQNMDGSKIARTVEKIITGYKDVVVPGPQIPYTVNVVNYKNILDAALMGTVIGAGMTGIDAAHEANHQTKKRVPGEFDIKNPTYSEGNTIMDIVERRQKELNKQREAELEDEER